MTSPRWPTRIDLLALGGVLVLALVNLAQPLHFDQTVFMMGAKRMAAGGVAGPAIRSGEPGRPLPRADHP
jgi:hypothetical protein